MKAMINRFMFSQTNLDSGSLTMLTSIIHRFSEPGEYHAAILRGEDTVGRFSIAVGDRKMTQAASSAEWQQSINIDLKRLDLPGSQHLESEACHCFMLKPGGYAVFHVSTGAGGYSVEIRKTGTEHGGVKVFDSRQLKDEDILTATVLRPGTYSITNVNTKAKAGLVVAYPEIGKIPKQPETVQIECTRNALIPDKIRINPTEGLLFRFKTTSRIKIELIKPEDRPELHKKQTVGKAMKKYVTPPSTKKVIRRLRLNV
jgi:hypothetical protein